MFSGGSKGKNGKKRVKVNNRPIRKKSIEVALVFLFVPFEKLFAHNEILLSFLLNETFRDAKIEQKKRTTVMVAY